MAYTINFLADRVGSTTYRTESSKDLNGLSRRSLTGILDMTAHCMESVSLSR
jgi:hypothetical protein